MVNPVQVRHSIQLLFNMILDKKDYEVNKFSIRNYKLTDDVKENTVFEKKDGLDKLKENIQRILAMINGDKDIGENKFKPLRDNY